VSAAMTTAATRQTQPANLESVVMCVAGQVGSGLSSRIGK
jgi:hypothetical protein